MARNGITLKDLEAAVSKNDKESLVEIGWNGITLKVKRRLSLSEMIEFVRSTVDMCFSSNGDYLPCLYQFSIDVSIMTVYAGLPVYKDAEKQYALTRDRGLMDAIVSVVDQEQFQIVMNAVSEQIKYDCDLHKQEFEAQAKLLLDQFQEIITKTDRLLSGVDVDSLKQLAKAVSSDGGLDSEKIVDIVSGLQKVDN